MTQIIKLSDNAANRIKEIMSKADEKTIGVRIGVQSGVVQACHILWNMQKSLDLMRKLLKIKG